MQLSVEVLIRVVGRIRRAYDRRGGLMDARAGAHDRWASWWRFTQAGTHGRRVVVDRWVRAWVRAAIGRGLWFVAGSQDRGPAVAEVWVGVGLADFSGSKPCPRGF